MNQAEHEEVVKWNVAKRFARTDPLDFIVVALGLRLAWYVL